MVSKRQVKAFSKIEYNSNLGSEDPIFSSFFHIILLFIPRFNSLYGKWSRMEMKSFVVLIL